MASDNENVVIRTATRALRFLGISDSSSIADAGRNTPADNVDYGMWSIDEMRHFDGVTLPDAKPKLASRRIPKLQDIGSYLESVADNTHTKAQEIAQLTTVAPELKVAKRVYIATMMSPTDLQTNKINITMNYDGLAEDVKTNILKKLNTFFNDEHHLAQKLARWLRTAGFETGAQAILVLPKHEMDVQNVIADVTGAESLEINAAKKRIETSTESLSALIDIPNPNKTSGISKSHDKINDLLDMQLDVRIESALEDLNASSFFDSLSDDAKKKYKVQKDDKEIESVTTVEELTKGLKLGTLKLLRGDGDAITVTNDISAIKKGTSKNNDVLKQLLKDAQTQFAGFDPKNPHLATTSDVSCYSISDNPKVGKGDLPIVIELSADSVIPVCAPRDNKNHIGYFVLLDENGQPISGKNTYFNTNSTSVTNRLAMQAARGVYGNATLTSFNDLTNNPQMMLQQMSDVFAVAVNKLLESKLNKQGLSGLNVNMHAAVGRAMFMNLLAKNRIRMVFVPEPMMVYYRFDHREDGTGKTLIEDAGEMLALRTTLLVSKLMAEVDNATLHRTIEVDIDEKDTNPEQTLQMVLHEALSKYSPSFSTEVQTAAEALVNRNISVKPKNMAGLPNDLSVSYEKSQGSIQGPNTDLMDKLNNWIGLLSAGLPASVLNQLGDNEFSRSVATTNMYFSNDVHENQIAIKPHNKKYVVNYVSCCEHLISMIRTEIGAAVKKSVDKEHLRENQSDDVKDEALEKQVHDVIASLDIDLPTPQMAAKKSHYEEISSYVESIEKVVEKVYPDEIVVDDNLKGSMSMVRSIIISKLLREFLPKLGCQALAEIPDPGAIEADYAKSTVLYLQNLKRRIKNIVDLTNGVLPTKEGDNPDQSSNPDDTAGGDDETGF